MREEQEFSPKSLLFRTEARFRKAKANRFSFYSSHPPPALWKSSAGRWCVSGTSFDVFLRQAMLVQYGEFPFARGVHLGHTVTASHWVEMHVSSGRDWASFAPNCLWGKFRADCSPLCNLCLAEMAFKSSWSLRLWVIVRENMASKRMSPKITRSNFNVAVANNAFFFS